MWNGNANTVTAVQYGAFGEDANPIKNSVGIYAKTEVNGKEVCLGVMNTNAKAAQGERRLYCTDENGNFKFNIWLSGDGIAYIGDSDNKSDYNNFAVLFNELKTEFNELKSKYNSLVTAVNANAALLGTHTHGYILPLIPATPSAGTSLPSGVPGQTGNPSTANIDNVKNTKIKYNE